MKISIPFHPVTFSSLIVSEGPLSMSSETGKKKKPVGKLVTVGTQTFLVIQK